MFTLNITLNLNDGQETIHAKPLQNNKNTKIETTETTKTKTRTKTTTTTTKTTTKTTATTTKHTLALTIQVAYSSKAHTTLRRLQTQD